MARTTPRVPLLVVAVACVLAATQSALAVRPSETLLPRTTKGYLSIPDGEELKARWNETQLGELMNDPVMQPFIEDLQDQIKAKLSKTGIRLGITWDDLQGLYGGELCLAAIQPDNDPQQHALALLVDVTGHLEQANALLEKIGKDVIEQGGSQSATKIAGRDVTVFRIPDANDRAVITEAFYLIHEDQLIATDHRNVMADIMNRFGGPDVDALKDLEAFKETRQKSATDTDQTPQIRWFVEPFGYAEVVRASAGGRKKRGTDLLKVLSNQGFRALQGLGGQVAFAVGNHDIQHHTMIYAPAVEDDSGETHRYRLAARMLEFPNGKGLAPQGFVPAKLATYFTFHWKMQQAFEYSKSMVNELIGSKEDEDLFEDILGSLAKDPDGPKVDIRKDLVAHLGERATLFTDNRLPITPKSERLVVAIELTDPEAVRETIDRAMKNDPEAKPHEFEGLIIWEILTDDAPVDVKEIDIQGFDPFGEEPAVEDEEDKEKPLLPNSAITVAHGHLLVSTSVEYLKELVVPRSEEHTLAATRDFQRIDETLTAMGAGEDAFRLFSRTDEAYQPTYELIRQGKMPQSETLLGKLLNRLLSPDEEGVPREQQIDGAKMPPFEVVQKYLGPAGLYVRSVDDGWYVAGCLLPREVEVAQQAKNESAPDLSAPR